MKCVFQTLSNAVEHFQTFSNIVQTLSNAIERYRIEFWNRNNWIKRCQTLSNCWMLSNIVEHYLIPSSAFERYWNVVQTLSNTIERYQAISNTIECCRMLSNIVEYYLILSNVFERYWNAIQTLSNAIERYRMLSY